MLTSLCVNFSYPALGVIEQFFMSLTNADEDGRIIITRDGKNELYENVLCI